MFCAAICCLPGIPGQGSCILVMFLNFLVYAAVFTLCALGRAGRAGHAAVHADVCTRFREKQWLSVIVYGFPLRAHRLRDALG